MVEVATKRAGNELLEEQVVLKPLYVSLLGLSPQEQINRLLKLGSESFQFLYSHLPPKGFLPASLGRHDNKDFDGTSWLRDNVEASTPAIDPLFRQCFPELISSAEQFYLEMMRRSLQFYAREDEWKRFDLELQRLHDNGMVTFYDELAPSTKTFLDGTRVEERWFHNQPDALARMISVSAAGIKMGLPLLAQTETDVKPVGEILLKTVAYLAPTTIANFACHSIWEGHYCADHYSNKRKKAASLIDAWRVFPKIQQDSQARNYPIRINRSQISDAVYQGIYVMMGEFPCDYTDPYDHPEPADLSQLTVANEVALSKSEEDIIVQLTDPLEREFGLIRYKGDQYKKGAEEAQWTLGLLYASRLNSIRAIRLFRLDTPALAKLHLDKALSQIDKVNRMIYQYGYLPELHFQNENGEFTPNNNDLSWGRAMTPRAVAPLVEAVKIAQQFYQQAA